MTQDEIIAMAREAGMHVNLGYEINGEHAPAVNALKSSVPFEWLERFAALVATKEREACADIVDGANTPDCGGWTACGISETIRARGNT